MQSITSRAYLQRVSLIRSLIDSATSSIMQYYFSLSNVMRTGTP